MCRNPSVAGPITRVGASGTGYRRNCSTKIAQPPAPGSALYLLRRPSTFLRRGFPEANNSPRRCGLLLRMDNFSILTPTRTGVQDCEAWCSAPSARRDSFGTDPGFTPGYRIAGLAVLQLRQTQFPQTNFLYFGSAASLVTSSLTFWAWLLWATSVESSAITTMESRRPTMAMGVRFFVRAS